MCLPGGHFIPHFFGSLEVGFPPTTKGPGLLPYLYSSPRRSDLFGEERSPACTTQLLVPPVLLGAASPPPAPHAAKEGLLLLLKGPCSEGRLSDSELQHEEGCMRAHQNHTLHHFMCNQNIFPTFLPYFTFCSEHSWAVGGKLLLLLPSHKIWWMYILVENLLQHPQPFLTAGVNSFLLISSSSHSLLFPQSHVIIHEIDY